MKRALFYLIGCPGAGKTSIVKAALAGVYGTPKRDGQVAYIQYPGGVQLGVDRPGFGGTDGLGMAVMPHALAWLATNAQSSVIAEGDRLASDTFFQRAIDLGYDLTVAWLQVPDRVLWERRLARGSDQNPTWLKGRASKVDRLGMRWAKTEWLLNGEWPMQRLADRLNTHPVFQALRSEGSDHLRERGLLAAQVG